VNTELIAAESWVGAANWFIWLQCGSMTACQTNIVNYYCATSQLSCLSTMIATVLDHRPQISIIKIIYSHIHWQRPTWDQWTWVHAESYSAVLCCHHCWEVHKPQQLYN